LQRFLAGVPKHSRVHELQLASESSIFQELPSLPARKRWSYKITQLFRHIRFAL